MNDNNREELVGWGQAAAAWMIFNNNHGPAGVVNNAIAQGLIEGQHTQHIVARNTGDERLGSRVGTSATLRVGGLWLAMFAAPAAVMALSFGLYAATGGTAAWLAPVAIPLAVAIMFVVGYKLARVQTRNQYVRAGLPTERQLNRAGYYEVEPNTWFNPVNERVIEGHAHTDADIAADRAAHRAESRQIRDLYKQMRNTPQVPQRRWHKVEH